MLRLADRCIDHLAANPHVCQPARADDGVGGQSGARVGHLLRRGIGDDGSLRDLLALLHQDVANGHVELGGDDRRLPYDKAFAAQVDVTAEKGVHHPGTERDKRQQIGPFDDHALHDSLHLWCSGM